VATGGRGSAHARFWITWRRHGKGAGHLLAGGPAHGVAPFSVMDR